MLSDIYPSTAEENDSTSISASLSNTFSSATTSYILNQIQLFLSTDKEKFCILKHGSTKPLAIWWRAFGYPTTLNRTDEFERSPGFISCFKCNLTSVYGPNIGLMQKYPPIF